MPVATKQLTVSVFPAPGRPESSTELLERPEPPAARPPRSSAAPTPSSRVPTRSTPAPAAEGRRPALPPIRPQTDERLLAELRPARPDDRSRRSLVAEARLGTSLACEDVRVPPLRRPGPISLALTALEVWRRLPPEQRRQIMNATRKQAPRAAAAALAYWRSRPPRRS